MKCSIMLHFIWVFTVCKSTRLEVSQIQRVNLAVKLHESIVSSQDTSVFSSRRALTENKYLPDRSSSTATLQNKVENMKGTFNYYLHAG